MIISLLQNHQCLILPFNYCLKIQIWTSLSSTLWSPAKVLILSLIIPFHTCHVQPNNIMYASDPGYHLCIHVPSSLSVQLWCLLPCDAILDPLCKIQAGCLLSYLPSLRAILSMLSYSSLNFLPCVECHGPSSQLFERKAKKIMSSQTFILDVIAAAWNPSLSSGEALCTF